MSRKCPCGSGKKAHKCCEISASSLYSAEEQIERKYRSLRIAEGALFTELWLSIDQLFGDPDSLSDALDIFNSGLPNALDEDDADPATNIGQFLLSWLWFDYRPLEKAEGNDGLGDLLSLAEVVVDNAEVWARPLNTDERALLRAGAGSSLSWYVVEDVREGLETTLRDLFTDELVVVRDYKASNPEYKGYYLLARVIRVFGLNVLMGAWPLTIPNFYTVHVLKARDAALEILSKDQPEGNPLLRSDLVIRPLFIRLASDIEASAREPRKIVNHDGDPLIPLSMRFEHSMPLTEVESVLRGFSGSGELEIDTKQNRKGELSSLEVTFTRMPRSAGKVDAVVVAHLVFKKLSLSVSVNSLERAEEVKALLSGLFAARLVFKSCRKTRSSRNKEPSRSITEQELAMHPEVQQRLQEHAQRHWESWFDIPVPMLDNMTPREAAKSERGRELLEALFNYYEDNDKRAPPGTNLAAPDVNHLRAALGLTTVS